MNRWFDRLPEKDSLYFLVLVYCVNMGNCLTVGPNEALVVSGR